MICDCEFVTTSVFKKLQPKQNYIAPYIRLPWNEQLNLIGKACNIFKTDYGFAIVTDMHKFNEFKLLKSQLSDATVCPIGKEAENQVQTQEEVRNSGSGRSKPPSVLCGIQLRAIPGRIPDDPSALLWFAPAGIHRFIVSCRYVQRVTAWTPRILAPVKWSSVVSSLAAGRVVSVSLP